MNTHTIDATLFSTTNKEPIKYKALIINCDKLLIYGLGTDVMNIESIDLIEGKGANYVRIGIHTSEELRVYLQYINKERYMAHDLYKLFENSM